MLNLSRLQRAGFATVGLLLLTAASAGTASADTPFGGEPWWTGGPGSDPAHAIALSGKMQNQLDPGKSIWYVAPLGGSGPIQLVLSYNSGNFSLPSNSIQLRIDRASAGGTPGTDQPGYDLVGQGAPVGSAPSSLSWSSSGGSSLYFVEVVNNATLPIGYAIAPTNTTTSSLNAPPPVESLPWLEG